MKSVHRFLILSASAFILFLAFLSIQYDTNGVFEALSLETGQLFPHNHILYRPIGWIVFNIAMQLGYSGKSLFVLQWMDAAFGAIGVGLFGVAIENLTRSRLAAWGACFWLATSFLYWYASTEVDYVILAAAFSAAALALAIKGTQLRTAVAAGAMLALGILTWQGNIFLLPCLVLLMNTRDWNWRRPAAMAVTAGAVSAGVYVLLGISMHHVRDVSGFFAWTLHYGVSDTLPMWGRWEGNRIPQAMISAFRSIVPTPLMIDPRMLSIGTPHLWGRIAVDIAGVAMSVLLLGAVVALWGKRENIRLSLCFAAGYACFLPFIIWWDPGQPEWFVVPNILLAGFLAVSWSARLDNGFARALCLVCIVAIAGGNFFSTFRPRHSQIGPDRGVAACVAANTKSDDLLLVAEWGWPDYMEYFYKRVPFNLIDESIGYNGNGQELMDKAMRVIRDTQRKGASVFTPDPAEYSPDHLEWLAGQAGVRLSHLQALNAVPAFKCGDRLMKVLVALP